MTIADAVICGAGVAGAASAYFLAQRGVRRIILVEQGEPLSLTSDKSTECYRNWWPGPGDAMVRLMNRSVDQLEQIAHATDNRIQLNRRGYVYATARPEQVGVLRAAAVEAASLGAGPLRETGYVPAPAHGFDGQPDGADLITDPAQIRQLFPYLSPETVAVLHARRCGWFSAQQLGMHYLEQAKASGAQIVRGRVTGVQTSGGRVSGVDLALAAGGTQTISTPIFVNAAGPMQVEVGQMLGVDIPVYCERHVKIAFSDTLGAVPRDAGLLIWTDPVTLPWDAEERAALEEDPDERWLLQEFPAGVHGRPEGHAGGNIALLLWTYDATPVPPTFPLVIEPNYPEIAVRGMTAMLPALRAYLGRLPKCYADGGYYARTPENRPLVGPCGPAGAYLLGALGGFGLMASAGCGELLALHATGGPLPEHAAAFELSRYADPAYQALLTNWGASGQL